MKKALQKLIIHYLKDVTTNEYSNEDLEYVSENLIKDIYRLKSARRDFKEV